MNRFGVFALVVAGPLVLAGCTVHPPGEAEERSAALSAGNAIEGVDGNGAALPELPAAPTVDELVGRALAANGEVRQRYWEWRAAIEQITSPAALADLAVAYMDVKADEKQEILETIDVVVRSAPAL